MTAGFGTLRSAVHAEWTKLRTTPGLLWLPALAVAATVTIGALAVGNTDGDVPASLTGVRLGQALIAIAGVLTIGDEYRTGMIRTTLAAMPHRIDALTSKIIVLTGVVVPAAAVATAVSLPMGADYPRMAGAFTGSVLYLTLIGLLSLGVATVLRDAAAAIGTVLGLLYVLPLVAMAMPDERWERRLVRISPDTALDAMETGDLSELAVLVWWVVAALITGAVLLRRRDV